MQTTKHQVLESFFELIKKFFSGVQSLSSGVIINSVRELFFAVLLLLNSYNKIFTTAVDGFTTVVIEFHAGA